jgi:hypothetical protein
MGGAATLVARKAAEASTARAAPPNQNARPGASSPKRSLLLLCERPELKP